MTSCLLACILGLTQLPTVIAAEGQKWHSDYGLALKAAQVSGKPLLILVQEPAQVTPVSTNRAEQKQITQLLANYELCRIDASSKYGQDVAKAFRASALPFTAIISKDVKQQLYRHGGALETGELISVLTQYQAGVKPVTYRLESNRLESNLNTHSFSGGFSRGRSC